VLDPTSEDIAVLAGLTSGSTSSPAPTDGTSAANAHHHRHGFFSSVLDHDERHHKEPGLGNGWKEFKRGTYTYPISFTIPNTAPPSLQTTYGSVVWRLNATVHRPGTFEQKLNVCREVLVLSCPTEEDTEDTDNVIVERPWEDQLQYLVSISGRSFYIGGTVPVTITLMPLAKVKVYRFLVYIDGKSVFSQKPYCVLK